MNTYNILKNQCRSAYLICSGNFWYEEQSFGDDTRAFYRICSFLLISVYSMMTILEILAATIGIFPEDVMRDAVTLTVSHVVILYKVLSIMFHKKLIRGLNKNMVNACEMYEEEATMVARNKMIKMNIIAYYVVVIGSVSCIVIEGFIKWRRGSIFITVVTYYPTWEDTSTLAAALRILFTLIFLVFMVSMITTGDSFVIIHLIIFKYKFISLRHYFENLRKQFDVLIETGDSAVAAEKLYKGLIEGIMMHEELLRISNEVDEAFNTVISLQLFMSTGSAVSLLLQIAVRLSGELTIVAILKVIFYVGGMFLMLALFLCNAGELSHQASLLSDAIFYCGWHNCPSALRQPGQHNVRQLVLQACLQANRPLIMKAFKMVELTYANFLVVVRLTYSVFAVFYAQNK